MLAAASQGLTAELKDGTRFGRPDQEIRSLDGVQAGRCVFRFQRAAIVPAET